MAASTPLEEVLSRTIRLLTFEVLHHTYKCLHTGQDSRLVEKRGSLVGFPGPPTYRDYFLGIYTFLCFSQDNTFVLLRARHHKVSAFPY